MDQVLRKSIKDSEIFKLRFRHTAARSFMILRNYMGRPISVNRQQVRSSYLLEMLGDMERVPVIEETYREVLEDDMDIKNARLVLDMIDSGRMAVELIHYTGTPSPFAHSAILSGFSDIVLMDDRSALLRELHRKVLYRALGDSVSEFEFTEDQVIPYFAQKPPRVMSKGDIPKLLSVTGPLQAMRERGRNIYAYTDEDKKTVDGWVRELIRDGTIGTVFLDEPHIMVSEEIPYYAAATRRERELTDVDRAVYEKVTGDTPLSEISADLEISDDVAFRSMRKLESMYLVTRTDVTGNNRWMFSKVSYPEVDKRRAADRIVMRYLECFAPATVQEVAFSLSLPEEDARTSLESLVASEEVSKGRFLISEDDQYMLKIDHMRLKAGRDNVYDYETVERYRLTKGERFGSIREFFEFYGSAGSELDVYSRVDGFDLSEWYSMRESGEILLGRFVRGRVRFVLRDEGDRYAALRHEEVTETDMKVLNMIDGMERATMRQLVSATGMDKEDVKQSIMRLDRSLLIIRDFDEREDWGTENTYAVYRPGTPEGDPAKDLVRRAIRAYGPIPTASMRFLVDIPLDEIERYAQEVGASTISVGEGQVPMLVMSDELPALEKVPEQDFPVRVLSLYDPDLGSKWAEISSRYGDRWIYPLVRGDTVVGALELWEMSGCIEIRMMDLDAPELLPDALSAIDSMMGFYGMKGTDIVRIREIMNTDAEKLDDGMVSVLTENGYHFVNGFYAKGRFVPWTMTEQEMLSYVFSKQRVPRNDRYPTVAAAMEGRGYIRGDQELMARVSERTTMKKQMERGGLMKMALSPGYIGYTTMEMAVLYRAEKAFVVDRHSREVLKLIARKQPVSKKDLVADSAFSPERTSEILSELSKNSVIYTDESNRICIVPDEGMDRHEAQKEIVRRHFRDFGIFSAETLSQFVGGRMAVTRGLLRELEDDGFLRKGFFVKDDQTLYWMLSDDVGVKPPRFLDNFVLNSQDNLHIYLRGMIKAETGAGANSVIFSGTRIVGSFKGKVCASGAKVEEFQGSDRAARILKEAAQSVGVSLETQRQRDDDDWDVSEFYLKVNTGA